MKLQKMNNRQYFVTLPNQIVRAKGWEKGDLIKVEIDCKGDIVLKK
jgi:bifunctional DNA-binding transcriptional regulator/antitoxin component of YhaV-PrlF toxin-antitoxin module